MLHISTLLDLLRVKNCLMAGVATSIGFFLAGPYNTNLIVAFVVTFLICGAGQVINDFFDSEIDAKINKHKPIPSKRITKKQALLFSAILFVLGVLLAILINFVSLLIAMIFAILLITYSGLLYKKKYFGNVIVAMGTAVPFIFGASANNNIPLIVFFFFTIAFFANLAREVTKDFEDLKKDNGFKKTLPMISKRIACNLIIFYYFISIILAFVIGAILNLNIFYYILLSVTTIFFVRAIIFLEKKDYYLSQSYSKKGMIISLLAFMTTIFL